MENVLERKDFTRPNLMSDFCCCSCAHLPCSLDLSPEILGLVYEQLAGLGKRTEKILLQAQLVAILENLLAVDVGLNTKYCFAHSERRLVSK